MGNAFLIGLQIALKVVSIGPVATRDKDKEISATSALLVVINVGTGIKSILDVYGGT